MTLYEYLASGYVLMLSFAFLRAVSGIPYVVASSGRYPVHMFWCVASLGFCLFAFWGFWSLRDIEWNIFRFLSVLALPALIYAYISLLLPPDPSAVDSWRDYFFEVRIPLFSTCLVLNAVVIGNGNLTLGIPLSDPILLLNLVHIAICVIGIAAAGPKVHGALALTYFLLFPVYLLLIAESDSMLRTNL
jgi:hypothetical protein